ncbi:MAG: hydrogenase iron-sulfur subunit, partial [Candidatus Aerophobus sp.]
VGIEKGRVQFSWISAAEGERFSQVIKEITQEIKALGPNKNFVKEI